MLLPHRFVSVEGGVLVAEEKKMKFGIDRIIYSMQKPIWDANCIDMFKNGENQGRQ